MSISMEPEGWVMIIIGGIVIAGSTLLGILNNRIGSTARVLHGRADDIFRVLSGRIDETDKDLAKAKDDMDKKIDHVEAEAVQRRDMALYLKPLEAIQSATLADIGSIKNKLDDMSGTMHAVKELVEERRDERRATLNKAVGGHGD